MKIKILISIAILLVALVVVVRYLFREKLEVFKKEIINYESTQLDNLRKEKESRIAALSIGDKKIMQLFTEQFDESKSINEGDTTFSFLYLSDDVKYKISSLKYIDCLYNKCIIDKQNELQQKLIDGKERELEKKFGETFSIWYPKFKDEKIIKKSSNGGICSNYFPILSELFYDSNVWNDFEKFMTDYNSVTRNVQIQNEKTENQFASKVLYIKSQLRSGVINYFDENLSNRKSEIITTETEQKAFNSPTLGRITYSIDKTTFNEQAFQNVADDAFVEQWKNNSLSTGATPYSYCFGSINDCDFSCSKITVRTGGSNVMVTIKDNSGDVVRHGYINGGYSYTFNVPDGQYQVFFYSGTGWNPNKIMTTNSCGTLRGGFVTGEDVTKDDYISLYSQQITYELILQQNGNLSTKPSSKSEAF